jgi:hypothetical protein
MFIGYVMKVCKDYNRAISSDGSSLMLIDGKEGEQHSRVTPNVTVYRGGGSLLRACEVTTRVSKYIVFDGTGGSINITPLLSSNLCKRRFDKLSSGKQSLLLMLLKHSKDPSATLSLHLGIKRQGVKLTKMLTKLPR